MLLIRGPHPTQINAKRSQATTRSHSIGHSQSGTGSDKTGRKHSNTDPKIKRGQISRGRRTAHIMRSDIDKEALESRNPYSVPDANHQGAGKENPRLVDSRKHGKHHQQADRRADRHPMYLPMIDQSAGDQARRSYSYRHINKEIARIGHLYFLSVQNNKRGNHPIRNSHQDISKRSRQRLHQDKTVEGKMRPRHLFPLRIADQANRTDSDKSCRPTDRDNRMKPAFPIARLIVRP